MSINSKPSPLTWSSDDAIDRWSQPEKRASGDCWFGLLEKEAVCWLWGEEKNLRCGACDGLGGRGMGGFYRRWEVGWVPLVDLRRSMGEHAANMETSLSLPHFIIFQSQKFRVYCALGD
jgi:hypothetical protein